MLTPDELRHYQRHLSLPEFGPEAQERLKAGSVLVIGAGGLGCPALQYLAAAGVGRIGICDFDRVEASNLQRQVLFGYSQLHQPKAEAAAERLADLNPHVELRPHLERFSPENAERLLADYDLVLDGTDNFPTRYLVNDACVKFGKPLAFGSIFKFEGQVTVFNHQDGPTYRCLFPKSPNPKDVPNCAEIGVIGVLPGIIGSLQANEAIKILSGVGEVLSGKLLLFDALTLRSHLISFSAVPENKTVDELREIDFSCDAPSAPAGTTPGPEPASPDSDSEPEPEGRTAIPQLTPEQVRDLLAGPEPPLLVDVREPWELDLCKIEGALSLPLGHLRQPPPVELPPELSPEKETIFYCHAGVRSQMACEILTQAYGFRKTRNLVGGIDLWAQTIDPDVPRY